MQVSNRTLMRNSRYRWCLNREVITQLGESVIHVDLVDLIGEISNRPAENGSSVAKSLPKAGLLKLTCYVHPWQHAYIYSFDQLNFHKFWNLRKLRA